MGESATYALYVDWNNDGDFGDAGEDISADWMQIRIERGFSSPLARFPVVGRMDVLLKNAAKTYSPPETAAARPRRPVKLDMTYDGTTVTLFRGWIETLRPAFGTKRSRRALMECVDAVALLDQYEGEIALQTEVYADDIIEDVVAAVYTPPSTSYQAGLNLFRVGADRWTGNLNQWNGAPIGSITQKVSASGKIEDCCRSDWGRFFVSGPGATTYHNRRQTPFDTTTVLTLDDAMTGMDYQMGVAGVYNYIEVKCYPRHIGETNEVLGKLDQTIPPIIEDGESVTFDIRFRDSSNTAISLGGLRVITPVAATDFSCTDDEAGDGTDENANITPSLTAYGDHAEITLENAAGHPVWVQSLQVRGLAVRSMEPVTVIKEDATSQGLNQKRRLRVDAPLMSNPIDAENLAEWLLDYYKDPLHTILGVAFYANTDATRMAAARDLELQDRVVLTETQTGLSAQAAYVYVLRHEITQGRIHRVSMDLEQAYDYGGVTQALWNTAKWNEETWTY